MECFLSTILDKIIDLPETENANKGRFDGDLVVLYYDCCNV